MIKRMAVCLVALLWPALVSAACVVQQRANVKLQIVGTVVLVPVAVNGIGGSFILDTGAAQTVVTPDAVNHFGLALDEWTATTMRGVGGVERRRNADPRSVELGGVALHRRSLARDATLRVATLPRNMVGGRQIDGLLGRDFLSLFDLDLDFPRQTLTLYDVHGCTGRFLPWTEPYLSLAVDNPRKAQWWFRWLSTACRCGRCWTPAPAGAWSRRPAWPVSNWALTNCRVTRAKSSVAWVRTLSQCGNTNFANFRSAARASPIRCFSSHQFNYNQSATCCWAQTGCSAAGSGFPMRPINFSPRSKAGAAPWAFSVGSFSA